MAYVRLTVDHKGLSENMLGLYADFVEEALQTVIDIEAKQVSMSIPKRLLNLAALSGQVISLVVELGAIVEETKVGESVGKEAEAKLAILDEILPKLTALTLMLNYSLKGQEDNGQQTDNPSQS